MFCRIRCCVLVFAGAVISATLVAAAPDTVADEATAEPGLSTANELSTWTREGELGTLPVRRTDTLPLSDQDNVGNWQRVDAWSDEFNGDNLDQHKWTPRHRSWRGRQPSFFYPGNVVVRDGELQITMKKEEVPEMPKHRGYHTYTSGAVHGRHLSHYGYFEVRAKPMDSAGSSSFWFAHQDGGWRTEIDVFEIGGKAVGFESKYNMNLHVFYTPKERRHWSAGGKWIAPWRLADDFHVYGLDWNTKEIAYYVDGVCVRRVENTHWHQPLYMLFDSETMPDWLGLPEDEDLPSTYRIDYVRAWRSTSEPAAAASGGGAE